MWTFKGRSFIIWIEGKGMSVNPKETNQSLLSEQRHINHYANAKTILPSRSFLSIDMWDLKYLTNIKQCYFAYKTFCDLVYFRGPARGPLTRGPRTSVGDRCWRCGVNSNVNNSHFSVPWDENINLAWPYRILTWHRNETRSLAIADWIWYSAGE